MKDWIIGITIALSVSAVCMLVAFMIPSPSEKREENNAG